MFPHRNRLKVSIFGPLVAVSFLLLPMASALELPVEEGEKVIGIELFSTAGLEALPAVEMISPGSKRAMGLFPMQEFFVRHSDAWTVGWDLRSDRPELISGQGIPLLPGQGNSLAYGRAGFPAAGEMGLEDVASRLRKFIQQQRRLLRISTDDLVLDQGRSAVMGHGNFWSVEFHQMYQGVPVDNARVFFRINHGNIVQFGTYLVADIDLDVNPSMDRENAWQLALGRMGVLEDGLQMVDRGRLSIRPVVGADDAPGMKFRGVQGKGYQHLLTWTYTFIGEDNHGYRVVVDAHSGEVLEVADETRFAEVRGMVYPVTNTSGTLIDAGLPFATVTNGGTKITDANGQYSYSGGTATVTLNGRYTNMNDSCGSISLSNSTTGNIDFGGAGGTDCTTPGFGGSGNTHSSRTGFYHLTNINRKAAGFLPGNTWLDGTLTANMNLNSNCNAYWNGSTVNFFTSGGGCGNTGEIAAVFLHEWGHGIDTNAGGNTGDQGTGEAVGDSFAMFELRDPCIGENFDSTPCYNCNPTCTGVRDPSAYALGGISTIARPDTVTDNSGMNCDRLLGLNNVTCPYIRPDNQQPYQGVMGYEGHCESYIASAANWDLAQSLIAAHGTEPGWAAMENIWYSSLTPMGDAYRITSGGQCNPNANVDGCGSSNWYTLYLAADDDDGNLSNGTPNGCRIWDAFDAHGIACGTRPACSTTCTPTAVADAGADRTICSGDSTTIGSGAQSGHTYSWSPGGGTASQISVSPTSTTTYTVTATTSCGSAQDAVTVTVDSGGGGGLNENFDSGLGSWTTSGLWHRVTNSSCASPGYSSASSSVYYGQDSSCNYNTGAATTGDLISPVISGINSSSTLTFDFFRQVESYTGGSYDKTEVAVKATGSSSWTTVWSRDSTNTSGNAWTSSGAISLSAFDGQDVQVRFQFNSVDTTANTFTGWFIDDVVVTADSACTPSNTAPSVSISAPANGSSSTQGQAVTFTGTATDAEDGSLTGSLSWSSNLDGNLSSGGSFSTSSLSVGSHTVTASVTDSGSLSGSASVSITVNAPPNTAPSVSVTAPANGSTSTQGNNVTFTGTANDTEDGSLSSSISWSSSLDGNLGTGASVSSSSLSVGTHTITASVTDSGSLSGSDTISITVQAGGATAQTATFDPTLQAPQCAVVGISCTSAGLLDGRGTKGPEPNQPNTINDSCADGGSGNYHVDESIDQIKVSTTDGSALAAGKTVTVEVTVYAYSTFSSDHLDLYYAADANNPSWQLIGTVDATQAGTHTLSTTYTLPSGSLQAVRGNFRYNGSASSCSTGNWDDHDDLIFAVN